jgi:hypothetical protein
MPYSSAFRHLNTLYEGEAGYNMHVLLLVVKRDTHTTSTLHDDGYRLDTCTLPYIQQEAERDTSPLLAEEIPCTSRMQGLLLDTPCTSIMQGLLMDTPCTSTMQGLFMDTPCTFTMQAMERETPCLWWKGYTVYTPTYTLLTVEMNKRSFHAAGGENVYTLKVNARMPVCKE